MTPAEAVSEPALRSFVTRLRADQDAVTNGLSLRWSSGAVEGHVNRIKMLKRQMYGRASPTDRPEETATDNRERTRAVQLNAIYPELRTGVEARPARPLKIARHRASLRHPSITSAVKGPRKVCQIRKLPPYQRLNSDPLWGSPGSWCEPGGREVLAVEDWAEVRRLHRAEGMPVKAIARTLGILRNTVGRRCRARAAEIPARAGAVVGGRG
jgi:hypothetical protein